MISRPHMRVLTGLLIAAVVAGVAAALGLTLWAGQGSSLALPAEAFAWLIPVIIAGLVGLLGWALMSSRGERDRATASTMVRCSSCDALMMQGWRMCPYCGFMKEDGERRRE